MIVAMIQKSLKMLWNEFHPKPSMFSSLTKINQWMMSEMCKFQFTKTITTYTHLYLVRNFLIGNNMPCSFWLRNVSFLKGVTYNSGHIQCCFSLVFLSFKFIVMTIVSLIMMNCVNQTIMADRNVEILSTNLL